MMWHRTMAWVVAGACGVSGTLSACGTQWAYDNADTLIAGKADGYFDMTAEQERWVAASLERHHAWHRAEALPAYVEALSEIRTRSADGVDDADMAFILGALDRHADVLARQLLDDSVAFLGKLGPEQVTRFEKKLREGLKDAREKLDVSASERLDDRVDWTVDLLEEWVGSLSDAQEAQIRKDVAALPDAEPERLRERAEHDEGIIALIKAGDAGAIRGALTRWLIDPPLGPSPENRAAVQELVVRFDKTLDAKQRKHLLDKLQEWIDLFQKLHDQKAT